MKNKDKNEDNQITPADDQTSSISRRSFLTGFAALSASASLGAYGMNSEDKVKNPKTSPPAIDLDKALKKNVKNVVVIYAENRSFNNLFGDFPGLENPL